MDLFSHCPSLFLQVYCHSCEKQTWCKSAPHLTSCTWLQWISTYWVSRITLMVCLCLIRCCMGENASWASVCSVILNYRVWRLHRKCLIAESCKLWLGRPKINASKHPFRHLMYKWCHTCKLHIYGQSMQKISSRKIVKWFWFSPRWIRGENLHFSHASLVNKESKNTENSWWIQVIAELAKKK